MDFKNSYRVEAVYFQKLKSDIDIAKSYIAAGATDEARAVLENLVDVDGAVLLLYRNIGECWAELANAIEKTKKELDALRDQQEQYHDELNEKIDEINNYIIRLINALDERLTAAEADIDDLQERMLAAESDIDDLEANKQDKLTPGFGIEIDANNEISVDTDDVQEKLIAGQNITLTPDSTDPTKTVIDATGGANYSAGFGIDIDANNEISVDTNDVQEKLSAGFGIDIDANNEISVDTSDVQEKLIAGQNITLTPDSTDPTKTVIDANVVNYSAGSGIEIDSNNVISFMGCEPKNSGLVAVTYSSAFDNSYLNGKSVIRRKIVDISQYASDNYKFLKLSYNMRQLSSNLINVTGNLEYLLQNWNDKVDFDIFVNILLSNIGSGGTSTPSAYSQIAGKREIRFDNGNLKSVSPCIIAGNYPYCQEDAKCVFIPYNPDNTGKYIHAYITYVPVDGSVTSADNLKTFIDSLTSGQKDMLCNVMVRLYK